MEKKSSKDVIKPKKQTSKKLSICGFQMKQPMQVKFEDLNKKSSYSKSLSLAEEEKKAFEHDIPG